MQSPPISSTIVNICNELASLPCTRQQYNHVFTAGNKDAINIQISFKAVFRIAECASCHKIPLPCRFVLLQVHFGGII